MGRSEVSTNVVKWSEGLSKRISIIIRRHINGTKFAAYMAVPFIIFFHQILVLFYIIVIWLYALYVSVQFCKLYILIALFPMPPHVLYGLRGLRSWAWQKCNRLLRLGRPCGAVTLSR